MRVGEYGVVEEVGFHFLSRRRDVETTTKTEKLETREKEEENWVRTPC